MATFQDFSLLDRKVNEALTQNEFSNIGYSFGYVFLEEYMQDIDDVEEIMTDGSGDLGIDAFQVDQDANTVDIFQFKYATDFETTKTGKIKQTDLDKLLARLDQILNKNASILKYANPEIQRLITNFWKACETTRFDIRIHFVTNLESPVTESIRKTYDKSFDQYGAVIRYYDLNQIIELVLAKRIKRKDVSLQFSGKSYFQKQDGDIRCLTGTINALKMIDAISGDGTLDETIFDENVRMYLKSKGEINAEIQTSALSNENYKFFYFNNGITVICDRLRYTPGSDSPVIEVQGIQIVNGSQTLHSLYEIYKDPNLKEKLQDVYLLIRIYEVTNRQLGQDIARFTNSQNPVKGRDTHSNDWLQVKLQEQFSLHGYFYSRKKNEFADQKGIDKASIVDAEKVGQLVLSFYLEKPGDAKNKKTEIYKKDYYQIFDEEKLTPEYILLPLNLFKKIEERIKPLKKEKRRLVKEQKHDELVSFINTKDYLLHGSYYLLFTLNILARANKVKTILQNQSKIEKLIPKAEKLLEKMVSKHRDTNEPPAALFKSNNLVSEIKAELEVV